MRQSHCTTTYHINIADYEDLVRYNSQQYFKNTFVLWLANDAQKFKESIKEADKKVLKKSEWQHSYQDSQRVHNDMDLCTHPSVLQSKDIHNSPVAATHGGSAGQANAKHDNISHVEDLFYEIPVSKKEENTTFIAI